MSNPCGSQGFDASELYASMNGEPFLCVSAALIASCPALSVASERISLVVLHPQFE